VPPDLSSEGERGIDDFLGRVPPEGKLLPHPARPPPSIADGSGNDNDEKE